MPHSANSSKSFKMILVVRFQDGEAIDFTWVRHKPGSKKSLKIKDVEAFDTGVYICKGINGFGSATVRFEVIVIGK